MTYFKANTIPMERIRELYVYNPETGIIYYRANPSKEAGYATDQGYKKTRVDGTEVVCHRLAWALHYGAWPTEILDHIDRVRDNNRIDNLRQATSNQNANNTFKGSKAGRIGVKNFNGRWQAQISRPRKTFHLGCFDTRDEAAHAYNKAAIELHGEFALLNPIGEDDE